MNVKQSYLIPFYSHVFKSFRLINFHQIMKEREMLSEEYGRMFINANERYLINTSNGNNGIEINSLEGKG